MTSLPPDLRFTVEPFQRQQEDDEVIIGIPSAGTFLALSPDAVELLDSLATGCTLAEAQVLYQNRNGEWPDPSPVLNLLERKGFIHPLNGSAPTPSTGSPGLTQRRFHFTGISRELSQLLYGRAALCLQGAIILTGLFLACTAPAVLLPHGRVPSASHHFALSLVAFLAFSYGTIFLHEMAHLIAARSLGVSCKLGLGRRLWILVAETDMSGIWLVPRHKRFLPFLAGPLLDLTSACALLIVLFVSGKGWLFLPEAGRRFCAAAVLLYGFRLAWQCYFFLRTDFYYVFSNLCRCKNLMGDTEAFLANRFRRWVGATAGADPLESLPVSEQRTIRVYALFWLLGRAGALLLLFAVQLPLLVRYLGTVLEAMHRAQTPYQVADALFVGFFSVFTLSLGLALWARSLWRGRASLRLSS